MSSGASVCPYAFTNFVSIGKHARALAAVVDFKGSPMVRNKTVIRQSDTSRH